MPELGYKDRVTTMSKSHTYENSNQLEEDKVSDSGTYTIEDDSKELVAARRDIDKVFGIPSRYAIHGFPLAAAATLCLI